MLPELHPNRVPGAETAIAVQDKFLGYLFNPASERGAAKGAYLRKVGFNEANWESLRDVILARLPYVEGRYNRDNGAGGQNFEAGMVIDGPSGRATILTTWVVTPNAPTALIGMYPLGGKKRFWGILSTER